MTATKPRARAAARDREIAPRLSLSTVLSMIMEKKRLQEARDNQEPWKKWGPYLSERQWGTVREDYSNNGDAWNYFPHDHARSRGYRRFYTMDGLRYPPTFLLNLGILVDGGERLWFPDVPCFAFKNLKGYGFNALIGRAVLRRLVFTYHGPNAQFSLLHA